MTEPTIGVVFRPQSAPEHLREVALAAEAAGVAELWLWEDCFAEGGLTAAAAALAWTERLRVGVGLLPVPLRNPALAAMEIATVARMFPGRFVPGLGHGVLHWMAQVGARAPSPMTLLREYTDAVRVLLHGGRVDVDGSYVHLHGVALDWPPEQVPPLLVGARGPKTLRLAGELGDGVILDSGATLATVRAARVAVDDGRAARRPGVPGASRVVAFVAVDGTSEADLTAADLTAADLTAAASRYAAAGADVVVFEPPGESPDPLPLVAACGELTRRSAAPGMPS